MPNIGWMEILILFTMFGIPAIAVVLIVFAVRASNRRPLAPPPLPAGWFADPTGRHAYRYWDGSRWSSEVADGGVQSQDPLQSDER